MVRRIRRPESPPTDTAIPGAVEFFLISRRGWVVATARSSWHLAAHSAKDHYLLMPLTSRIGTGICRARARHAAWLGFWRCRAGCGPCRGTGKDAGWPARTEGQGGSLWGAGDILCQGAFPTRHLPCGGAWWRTAQGGSAGSCFLCFGIPPPPPNNPPASSRWGN